MATLPPGGTTFSFLPLEPGGGGGAAIEFRAHITNISDSHSPSWGENMDMGRADPKLMYQSYSRSISVDFWTAAVNPGEHKEWLRALSSVAEMTKPKYKSGQGFQGIFTKLIVGDLIDEIGVLTAVDYSIDNETPWIDDIPLYVNCSVSLKVVGAKRPSYKQSGPTFQPGFGLGKSR